MSETESPHAVTAERALPDSPQPTHVFAAAPASANRPVNTVPALSMLALAILVLVVYQMVQLFGERDALQSAARQLAPQVEAATKVRATLDAIATGVKRLSDGGNTGARTIVDELGKRGVTINPNQAPPAAAVK